MLKLGVIDVLNVLPVYYGVLSGLISVNCELVTGKVTVLNQKLHDGEIDISVISSFEYAKNFQLYNILPDLSVSADGPVRSIYLFLKKPIEKINDSTIKLTAFSFTSVHLIQYLLQDMNIEYIVDDDSGDYVGEVLIADEAIRRFYQQRDAYVYDLSELWKKKTGLPFVFALWCVRKDVYKRDQTAVNEVYSALLESKKTSRTRFRQMAKEYNMGVFPEVEACESYLKNLHYNFSLDYQKGFNLFQAEMVKINKLKRIAPLEFI